MRDEARQRLIDAEVRATRLALVRTLRRRAHGVISFLDEDFLAIADGPTVCAAILDTALAFGVADRADFQTFDPHTRVVRLAAQRGFAPEFLTFFADLDLRTPTACTRACLGREPVLVSDVTRSPVFDAETRTVVLESGTRAVGSFPLYTSTADIAGVVSFHHDKAPSSAHNAFAHEVAVAAAIALGAIG